MIQKRYFSTRSGKNPNLKGFNLIDFKPLFLRLFYNLDHEGYFTESFGFTCVDSGFIPGKVSDPEYEILIRIRKTKIWPIPSNIDSFTEDDLFDAIEYLFDTISKPIDGTYHSWNDCGMHWETFNKKEGQKHFVEKINELFDLYENKYEISDKGEILAKAEAGFDKIIEADIPTEDANIKDKMNNAIIRFRKHGSSLEERKIAVRDLADTLEYLRPKLKELITTKDEGDLFNIANNFGIRHHNENQKTNYDQALWLSWMFYFYLATIHLVLRKIENIK